MENRAFYILVLILTIWWKCFVNGLNQHTSDYEVGGENDTEENGKSYKPSALAVSRGIAEVGKTFHYGIIGEINKVTKVDDVDKMGFFLKKFPALKHIPKLAGAFGAVGTMLSIVFSFIPTGDSPELAYMKQAFSEMNKKLDEITESLDESKILIKEYSQKSAYLQAEHNIIRAYNQLDSLVTNLMNVTCATEAECQRKKMKMVDNYKDDFNVRGDVEMVLRGALQDSVFGTSILTLVSEKSDCYINKIKNFQSAVAALAVKGSSAAMFYDMVTKDGYDIADDVRRFQRLMFELEKRTEDIIFNCYQNIDRYIASDVIDLDQKSSESSIGDANKHILLFLSMKYPWMEFYVISAKVGSNPLFWTNESFHTEVNANGESENANIRNFILIGSRSRVENEIEKKERFQQKINSTKLHYKSWFKVKYDEAVDRLLGVVEYDKYLNNQFRTITILPEYDDALVGYIGPDATVEQYHPKDNNAINKSDLLVYEQCRHGGSCTHQPIAVTATIHSKDQDISECQATCNSHGTCFFLPHTKVMGCKCDADHYGEECNKSVSETNMALDLIKLIDISFKLPSLFDVSTQLGDVRVALQADLNDIQNSIKAFDKKLTNLFDTFRKDLMTSLDFHGLITQYGEIVRDLKYYYHILIERNVTNAIPVPSYFQMNGSQSLDIKEKEELAMEIVKPTKLRRSLEYLSYLFFGRQDISLISHKPLLFLTMDKHHSQLCSAEYKRILDNAYKQLTLLEFQGYIVWIHALELLQLDTFFVVERYNDVARNHKDFFESHTCQIEISNSVNFEDCINGYYLYSGMKEDVRCADNFYLTNQSISLYVDKVIRVSSEESDVVSSAKEVKGSPDVYPLYGEHGQAWSPSKSEINKAQFIEVAFKDPLFVEDIQIYETFHGGAVWKIEGMNQDGDWKVLMEKSKQNLQNIQSARILTINIKTEWSLSKLRVNIDCTKSGEAVQIDAIQIKGRPVEGTCSWYSSFSCTPCGCDTVGSSSKTCSADGQCECKTGYKGKRCISRDCVIEHWSAWSDCECGPGKTKTRTRRITQRGYGSGKACGKTSETSDCNLKCQCGKGERGDYCEHKDCLVSNWDSWSSCPSQELKTDCNGDQHRYAKRYRYRSKTRNKQNNGAACPNLKQEDTCKKPLCKQIYEMNAFRDD